MRMTVTMIMVMMVMLMKMTIMTQVVNFIRAAREPHSGSLVLAVRQVRMIKRLPDLCLQYRSPLKPTYLQNVYLGEEGEEPVFQYVPEKRLSPGVVGAGEEATPLHQSLLLLEESLESGAITGQFEQLYRRNPSLAISVCHLTENAAKNR